VHVKSLDAHRARALLGARAQLVGMTTRLSNHIRGVLKTFGMLPGATRGLPFDRRVEELLAGREELAGVVGHDHGAGEQALIADRTPERALGGDTHGVRGDFEGINAEPGQVRRPRRRVGKLLGWCASSCATTWPDRLCPRMYSNAAVFTT